MHITSVHVTSLNGRLTKGDDGDTHSWTSPEDWQAFTTLRDSFDLLVMGSGTYNAVKPKPDPGRLRVVMTRHPAKYSKDTVPGQLEFVNAQPQELVAQLAQRGYKRMLLVGGRANTTFMACGLVDELYLTIEPVIFGTGQLWQDGFNVDIRLRLQSVKQLNTNGTLLLHYTVT